MCTRRFTALGMSAPAHISPRCITPASSSRRVKLCVFIFLSGCADGRQHRQDDVFNERRMKKRKDRPDGDEKSKKPSAHATSQSNSASKPAALRDHARA